MRELPIRFNAPMVRAIMDGRKTQTRRIVKPQPIWVGDPSVPFKTMDADPKGIIRCPFGKPGDRLWVIQFKPIPFGDGKYAIADDGNLYDISCPFPRRRRVRISHNGYEEITLRHKGIQQAFRINRLVAEAFYGSPNPGDVAHHLDGNRRNNMPENIDWCTPKQNSNNAVAAGSFYGKKGSQSSLSQEQVLEIKSSVLQQKELARIYGVTQPTISKIRSGKRWAQPCEVACPRNRPITFSRITLEVKAVRVERLQEISPDDLVAEGIEEMKQSLIAKYEGKWEPQHWLNSNGCPSYCRRCAEKALQKSTAEDDFVDGGYPGASIESDYLETCEGCGKMLETSLISDDFAGYLPDENGEYMDHPPCAEEVAMLASYNGGLNESAINREVFRVIWDALNAKRPGCSWQDNPLVWVVEFEPIKVGGE